MTLQLQLHGHDSLPCSAQQSVGLLQYNMAVQLQGGICIQGPVVGPQLSWPSTTWVRLSNLAFDVSI
jgi:hypothetical protein